jgi:N-acetylmuramic acid 6-phosphate etherase
MTTETASPRFSGIDAWPPLDILDALVEGQFAAVAAVRAVRPALAAAAAGMEERLRAGGRLAYAGAGTSGRLAALDATELAPTFGWPRDRIVLLIAGGAPAMLEAIEGAEDRRDTGEDLVREVEIGPADALIAVAASGTTPFTCGCLSEARRQGALTIGIASNPGTPLLTGADHAIWLDTGAETIAGSTRMKAGTAQKIALNLLSSLVMIRLGRVYGGLMVDVQATNRKLARRSEEMLIHLTSAERPAVQAALARADGSVKLAMLILSGCDDADARRVLAQASGDLRRALRLIGARPG